MESMHEIIERAGGTIDCFGSKEAGIRLEIKRKGAEPISLQRLCEDGVWRGFLYRDGLADTPSQGWTSHSTLMGYFIHRLWEQKSIYRGREIRGGTHGFLRHWIFGAPEYDAEGATLTYRLAAADVPADSYPLRVSFALVYRLLKNGGVEIEFQFENEEPELEAHVSFGMHPGIELSSLAKVRVLLPAGRYVRHIAPGDFLNGETEVIDHEGGQMPFAIEGLEGSYLLELAGVKERVFVVEDEGSGRKFTQDFGDFPYMTIWSNGADFICVEPCWGLPDTNPPTAFEDKPGIQKLPPKGKLAKSFRIFPEWKNPNGK